MSPIDVSAMEQNGKEVSNVRNAHTQDEVLAFLKKNKKHAYTQAELGIELSIKPQQARQCCMALQKKGLTVRKEVDVVVASGKTESHIHWRIV